MNAEVPSFGDGREVFTKRSGDPGQPQYEAAGLRWLADGGARVPEVAEVGPSSLTTSFVESVGATPESARELGRKLAHLHASGAPWFGAPPAGFGAPPAGFGEAAKPGNDRETTSGNHELRRDGEAGFACSEPGTGVVTGWMGRAPLPLLTSEPAGGLPWGRFYADYRIRPYVSDVFSASEKAEIEELCQLLDAGVLDHPQPKAVRDAGALGHERPKAIRGAGCEAARIHGDLWGGNVLWSAGTPTLIDPAAQGGHAETDLATLRTFGVPYLDQILQGYQEVSPLADGWEDRVGLHQLHILIIHCYLFGPSYVPGFMAALRKTQALARRSQVF